MGHSKGSPKRDVLSNISLPKKDRSISNRQSKLTPTRTGGTTTNKPQSCLLYTSDAADEVY